ncbi:MAG: M15 family metallopeptidase [Treponema sp.]|nr:M15 family metallopeptidase [Treponema sp.]
MFAGGRFFPVMGLCALMAAGFMLVSCQKRPETVTEPSQTLPPAYEKLSRVFASLGERAKEAIPNGNPAEFLEDLSHVLSSDEAQTAANGDISLLYLCDKTHYLPDGYEPPDLVLLGANTCYSVNRNNLYLRSGAEKALAELGEAARKDGISLLVSSTYRSYDYQVTVYNRLVQLDGKQQADRESARPGTSQHQLGTVVDFGSIDPSWESSAACQWLLRHASEYGWSLSFPDGYEDVTGYEYECWHFRYIGKEACVFQKKWFSDVQQFMLEFIAAWKETE